MNKRARTPVTGFISIKDYLCMELKDSKFLFAYFMNKKVSAFNYK